MKLLYCRHCGDIFNLKMEEKCCSCGGTRGAYQADGWHAWYSGQYAVPLGVLNNGFSKALHNQPKEGPGFEFTAFVIPFECPTFESRPS